jgi:hypothetical protein
MRTWCCLLLVASLGCARQQHPAPPAAAGPAILARVPADTPYVFATLDPWPPDYLRQVLLENRTSLTAARDDLRAAGGPGLLLAMLEELEPRLTIEGFAELGYKPGGRMVVYGLGLVPVARFELGDPAAFTAFFERVIARGGAAVTRGERRGGRVWTFALEGAPGGLSVAVAIDRTEGVVTLAPAAHLPRVLARALGEEPIGPSLREAGALEQLAAELRAPRHFIGYLDVARLLARLEADRELLAALGAELPPFPAPCREELAALAVTSPRWLFALGEVQPDRVAGSFIVELRPELARALVGARAAVPGLGAPLGGGVMTIGVALDVAAAVAALHGEADRVARVPRRCPALGGVGRTATELAQLLNRPLPPLWAGVRGGAVTLQSAETSFGVPQVKAYGVLAAADPIQLIDLARRALPSLAGVRIPADGSPVKLPAGTLPFMPEAHVAMRGGVLGAALGAGMEASLATLMAAAPHPRRPLVSFAYDERKLGELVRGMAGEQAARRLAGDGETSFTIEATDRGLVMHVERRWRRAPAP